MLSREYEALDTLMRTVKSASLSAALAALLATHAGCSPVSQGSESATSDSKEKKMAEYKENPNPTQAYLITLRIEGAPGPFASIKGFAQYDIVGEECLPVRDKFSGAQTTSGTAVRSVAFTQVSDDTYTATMYADGMQDADYFGRGVCRWQFTLAQAVLKATGAKEETAFIPDLWSDSVFAQKSEMKYFWFGYYPRAENSEDYSTSGDRSLEKVPDDKRDEFFTITLSSKEMVP